MTHADRKIGPILATCIVAGNMIGSGIFLLPATLAVVGAGSLIAWIAAALAAAILAGVYAQLAIIRPQSEGLIEYAANGIHPVAGGVTWGLYWLALLGRQCGGYSCRCRLFHLSFFA